MTTLAHTSTDRRAEDEPRITIVREGSHWRLDSSFWLPLPPEDVFPFFSDVANLERITPASLQFHVLTQKPIDIRSGALIDYRLKVRGIPIRWRTRIDDWQPPHRFVDTQLRGPYALWRHEHRFEPEDGGTRCLDTVQYRPRGGPLASLINRALVQRDVEAIFRYRSWVIREIFAPKGSSS